MNSVTELSIFTNWKSETYNSIVVVVNRLIKIVYYKLVKVIINYPGLAKVVFNVVVWHHDLSYSIVSDCDLLLISKFWSILCYFLKIK